MLIPAYILTSTFTLLLMVSTEANDWKQRTNERLSFSPNLRNFRPLIMLQSTCLSPVYQSSTL